MKQNTEYNSKNYLKLYYVFFASSMVFLFISHTIALWRFYEPLVRLPQIVSELLSLYIFFNSLLKYRNIGKIVIVLFTIVVLINFFLTNWYEARLLWLLFVLIIGAKGIKFREIVKFHLIIETFLCFSNVAAYFLGFINNSYIFAGDEREARLADEIITRLSFGYPAAGDFATHVLYLFLDYWILKRGIFRLRDYFLLSTILYILLYYSDARQASVCVFLLFLFSAIVRYYRKICSKISFFLIFSIPLLFFITLTATLLYDDSDIIWILADFVLSGRLHLGQEAIQEYGIQLLGQRIQFVGGGMTTLIDEYNYVDSGYIQFLLLWGTLIMSFFLLAFIVIGRKAYKREDYILLFSLLIAGISTVTTQFLFIPNYCILILSLTASYDRSLVEKNCAYA